eukprot:450617-Prymnesium_polylepis.1
MAEMATKPLTGGSWMAGSSVASSGGGASSSLLSSASFSGCTGAIGGGCCSACSRPGVSGGVDKGWRGDGGVNRGCDGAGAVAAAVGEDASWEMLVAMAAVRWCMRAQCHG